MIKQRCLHSKVSDPTAAEERLWGGYRAIQHLGIATTALQEHDLLDIMQGDIVISGMIKSLK